MNVRKSQEPVLYRIHGGGWSITSSVDAYTPPPHIAANRPRWPSIPRWNNSGEVFLEPIDATSPTFLRPSPTSTIPSCDDGRNDNANGVGGGGGDGVNGGNGGNGGNGYTPDDEVARLLAKLKHAEQTIRLQQKVIEGLCNLKMHVGE